MLYGFGQPIIQVVHLFKQSRIFLPGNHFLFTRNPNPVSGNPIQAPFDVFVILVPSVNDLDLFGQDGTNARSAQIIDIMKGEGFDG